MVLRQVIVALALAALFVCASGALAQNRPPEDHALVIGINVSGTPIQGVPELSYAVDDAEAIAGLLEDAGYKVVELIDDIARRENVVAELQRLAYATQPHDSVLIYFAGHGIRQKVGNGEYSYWLTYDATLPKLEVNGIRLTHLLDYVNDIPAKRKVLILDHCHSGEVDVTTAALDGARDARGVLTVSSDQLFSEDDFRAQVESVVADGLLILGAATDKAYEIQGLGHGILTSVLINAMSTSDADTDSDGKLGLKELTSYVPPRIAELAEAHQVIQEPILIERGSNMDWPLMTLSVQSGFDDVEALLGILWSQGNLDVVIVDRCYQALENVVNDSASSVDEDIIEQLEAVHNMGPGQWERKSRMLTNFVESSTGSP